MLVAVNILHIFRSDAAEFSLKVICDGFKHLQLTAQLKLTVSENLLFIKLEKLAVNNRWINLTIPDDSQTYLHHHLSLSLPAHRRSTPSCTSSPNHVWPSAVWRTAPTAPQWSTVTTVPYRTGSSTTTPVWRWPDASTSAPLIIFSKLLLAVAPEVSRLVNVRLRVQAGGSFSSCVVSVL